MAGQGQSNLLKQVLGKLLENQAVLVSQLVEGKMIEIAKGVQAGKVKGEIQVKIVGVEQVGKEKAHLTDRAYERLSKVAGGYQITDNGQSITISISSNPIIMNYIKSNIGVGDYVEYEFNHALLEELIKRWSKAHPKENISANSKLEKFRASAGLNASGFRAIMDKLKIGNKAKEAAQRYVETYLSDQKEIEIYLNQLAQSQDFQANLGRSTSVGDTILEGDGTINFPTRVVELKNYDLPSEKSKNKNPSIRWFGASDQVLFGKAEGQKNLYLKWLATKKLAYNGLNDSQFEQAYTSNLGAYLFDKMKEIDPSEEGQLKYIINKSRKSTNAAGQRDLELLKRVASKVVIIISKDGSKMMITGPLKELEEELSADIRSGKVKLSSNKGVGSEYIIFGQNIVSNSPAQEFASIGFEPRGLSDQIADARTKGDPTKITSKTQVPVTKLQSYLYYALLSRKQVTI